MAFSDALVRVILLPRVVAIVTSRCSMIFHARVLLKPWNYIHCYLFDSALHILYKCSQTVSLRLSKGYTYGLMKVILTAHQAVSITFMKPITILLTSHLSWVWPANFDSFRMIYTICSNCSVSLDDCRLCIRTIQIEIDILYNVCLIHNDGD